MGLIDLLPSGIYGDNATMQELQALLTVNINTLADNLNKMLDECFVGTASALLSRYEEVYGLQVDISKSNTWRRERITAKIRGTGTTTKQMIEEVAISFAGGEVEIIEHPDTNSFIIKFVGALGIPANMGDLTLAIEEIKPAHLAFTFEYSYRTWQEVSANLWRDVEHITWYELATT